MAVTLSRRCPSWFVEDQLFCCVLEHLLRSNRSSWKTITVIVNTYRLKTAITECSILAILKKVTIILCYPSLECRYGFVAFVNVRENTLWIMTECQRAEWGAQKHERGWQPVSWTEMKRKFSNIWSGPWL